MCFLNFTIMLLSLMHNQKASFWNRHYTDVIKTIDAFHFVPHFLQSGPLLKCTHIIYTLSINSNYKYKTYRIIQNVTGTLIIWCFQYYCFNTNLFLFSKLTYDYKGKSEAPTLHIFWVSCIQEIFSCITVNVSVTSGMLRSLSAGYCSMGQPLSECQRAWKRDN